MTNPKQSAEVHISDAEPAARHLMQRWFGQEPFSFTDDRGYTFTMVVMRHVPSVNPAGELSHIFWLAEIDREPLPGLPPIEWVWRNAASETKNPPRP